MLSNPVMWSEAAAQIFYSTGVGFGVMSAFASWRESGSPHLVADHCIVAFTNTGFSLLAGFAVYTVLGISAHRQGTPVDDVVESGPGVPPPPPPSLTAPQLGYGLRRRFPSTGL